jgi:hypothetical protein
MNNKHHLVLASIVLATEIFRFATKLVVLLGMIYNYRWPYAPDLGI